ncbi:MAG: hypothetical protein WC055_10175 [Melioribacteraceae bacterium]
MKFSRNIKPISCFKTHTSEVVKEVSNNQGTMIITPKVGKVAKVISKNVKVYEKTKES